MSITTKSILSAQRDNVETSVSVLPNREKVKAIVNEFLSANDRTTAACVSAAYYLRSFTEYHSYPLNQRRQLSSLIYDVACELRRQPHLTKTELQDHVETHYQTQEHDWHESIDGAIWDARQWLVTNDLPKQVLQACHQTKIRAHRGLLVVCICYALHQRRSGSWFVSAGATLRALRHHGLDAVLDKHEINRILRLMTKSGVIRLIAPAQGHKRCRLFQWVGVADLRASVFFQSGVELDFFSLGNICPRLKPFYNGALPFPEGARRAQETSYEEVPVIKRIGGSEKTLGLQQHIGGSDSPVLTWLSESLPGISLPVEFNLVDAKPVTITDCDTDQITHSGHRISLDGTQLTAELAETLAEILRGREVTVSAKPAGPIVTLLRQHGIRVAIEDSNLVPF